MAISVKLGERKVWKVNVGVASTGTRDHTKLENRDAADQHPIKSISGLEKALSQKAAAQDLKDHVDNKQNPHGMTAEQIGARPSDWMPTAEQVGARPDNWMPSASEVGARPNTWLPTPEQIGAAPALDWSHLKWYVMGDSLTAQDNAFTNKRYYDFVQEKTGIQVIVDGIGGTGYGAGASDGESYYDRVQNIPDDVDIVTIFGSGNDIRFANGANTEIWNTMNWLALNRPGLRVIVVPPSPWKGYDKREDPWKAYCDRLQVCALTCNFRYVSDMYDCPPFNPNFTGHMELFFTTDPEGIHPDENGHKALAPYFYNALLEELALDESVVVSPGGPGSSGGNANQAAAAVEYDQNVRAVNHRGYNTVAPENTIPAFILSKKNGFKYVECDVSFTSDGVAVLLHDSTIDRTSNGSGSISAMTYAEVSQYDFGSWKSSAYAGTKLPTLEEFLLTCKGLGLHPYIEIKNDSGTTQARVESIVTAVKMAGMKGKVTYISFNATYLGYVKAVDPSARLGFVCESVTESIITSASGLKLSTNEVFVDCRYSNVTDRTVSMCIGADIPLEVWTANTESSIEELNPYVSGVTSDSLIAGKVLYDKYIEYTAPDAPDVPSEPDTPEEPDNPEENYTIIPTVWSVGFIDRVGAINTTNTKAEMSTDYISVAPGQSFNFYNTDTSWTTDWIGVGFYDADKTFVSRITKTESTNLYEFTVPDGVSYMRISSRNMTDYHDTSVISTAV